VHQLVIKRFQHRLYNYYLQQWCCKLHWCTWDTIIESRLATGYPADFLPFSCQRNASNVP